MQRPSQLERDRARDFLTSRIDYERTLCIPYGQRDFRLDRMHQLLVRLGNPQESLAIVHVGGTKGKGSTAAMIAGVLRAAGYSTGLYSSPHLDRVEERIMIDGAICPDDEFAHLAEVVRPAVEALDRLPTTDGRGSNHPTYFEVITAMALWQFAERRVDAAVLEVGMGGRLDSTNVCRPLVSVITSISLDHTQQLGDTLAAIAGEKAGIIKPGVPVVSGVAKSEPGEVIAQTAEANHCRLLQLGRDFDATYRPPRHLEAAPAQAHMDFRSRADGAESVLGDVALNLTGRHQADNAAVGLATLLELRRQGWDISEAAMRRGLAEVCWPARIEVLRRRPTVVLDAAHNVASAEALARVLDESFPAERRLLVLATTCDKDARGMLAALLPQFGEVIFTRYRNNPRGTPPEELAAIAAEISPATRHVCIDPAAAWTLAWRLAGPEHLICIAGSFFIAAEMRAEIRRTAE